MSTERTQRVAIITGEPWHPVKDGTAVARPNRMNSHSKGAPVLTETVP